MIVLEYILLIGLIVCAVAAPLCKRLLAFDVHYLMTMDGTAMSRETKAGLKEQQERTYRIFGEMDAATSAAMFTIFAWCSARLTPGENPQKANPSGSFQISQ